MDQEALLQEWDAIENLDMDRRHISARRSSILNNIMDRLPYNPNAELFIQSVHNILGYNRVTSHQTTVNKAISEHLTNLDQKAKKRAFASIRNVSVN